MANKKKDLLKEAFQREPKKEDPTEETMKEETAKNKGGRPRKEDGDPTKHKRITVWLSIPVVDALKKELERRTANGNSVSASKFIEQAIAKELEESKKTELEKRNREAELEALERMRGEELKKAKTPEELYAIRAKYDALMK